MTIKTTETPSALKEIPVHQTQFPQGNITIDQGQTSATGVVFVESHPRVSPDGKLYRSAITMIGDVVKRVKIVLANKVLGRHPGDTIQEKPDTPPRTVEDL